MRSITYVLGALAGFFTFGGIGLIIKGYQVEGDNKWLTLMRTAIKHQKTKEKTI